LQALKASRVTLKPVWEFQQALFVLSNQKKVTLGPDHSRIQDNEDADILARDGWKSPFLSPETEITVSPRDGRLKIREWLRERHC
jgi:hypothetical protein